MFHELCLLFLSGSRAHEAQELSKDSETRLTTPPPLPTTPSLVRPPRYHGSVFEGTRKVICGHILTPVVDRISDVPIHLVP